MYVYTCVGVYLNVFYLYKLILFCVQGDKCLFPFCMYVDMYVCASCYM